MKRSYLIFSALVVLLVTSACYFRRSSLNTTSTDSPETAKAEAGAGAPCTRTIRLENDPQYDRALSIIEQRLDAHNENEYTGKFTFFPSTLVNCIKVIEEEIDSGAEGYFTFHSEDIKPDYYPVTINRGYYFTDDVLIAMLLAHEITHVQQYIDEVNGEDKLSCVDQEVDAFVAQLEFYLTLNAGENSSIYHRMQEDNEDLHPQLAMIKAMTTINRESGCEIIDRECKDANLRGELRRIISEDDFYRHQCEVL